MSKNPGNHTQRRLIYAGRVQGVGFRYTTASIARRHQVSGYVRNLRDGTVELVANGPAGEVDRFLDEVAAAFADHIDDCRSQPVARPAEYHRFEIRR